MSHIVAFVPFLESVKGVPVQCFRTDLTVGDDVVVRRKDGRLFVAPILQIKFLNWDCGGRVECRRDEATIDDEGNIFLPKGSPLVYGLSTHNAFIKALISVGWVPIKPKQKTYKSILANLNSDKVSYVFIRRNGIDIQILPRGSCSIIKPYSFYESSITEGRFVRHSLSHTKFNLFEGVFRFSNSFLKNEKNLDRYFVSQGLTDKRTDEMKKKKIQGGGSVQYAEYEDMGGWTVYKEIEPGDPYGTLESLKKRLSDGVVKNLKIKYGDKVPRDHFMGNPDAYWYGPSEAASGDF